MARVKVTGLESYLTNDDAECKWFCLSKYKTSCEFKKEMYQWARTNHDGDLPVILEVEDVNHAYLFDMEESKPCYHFSSALYWKINRSEDKSIEKEFLTLVNNGIDPYTASKLLIVRKN